MRVSLLILLFITQSLLFASKGDVIYSGIFTTGDAVKFPLYTKNKTVIDSTIVTSLKELQNSNKLQFNLQFETNTEVDKWDINDPFSLGILVTRDDISIEEFTSKLSDGRIIKNFKSTMKVGIVLFAYQTIGREKKRNIVYTSQYLGYDTLVTPGKKLSPAEESEFFVSSLLNLFTKKVTPSLSTFGVGSIIGKVESFRKAGNIAEISVGEVDGVEIGQRVQFGEVTDEFSPFGTVQSVDKRSAKVKVTLFEESPTLQQTVKIKNLRGLSGEIYQVTNLAFSSKKAEAFYKDANYEIGEDIAQ